MTLLTLMPQWMPSTQPLNFTLTSVANAWTSLCVLVFINISVLRYKGRSQEAFAIK